MYDPNAKTIDLGDLDDLDLSASTLEKSKVTIELGDDFETPPAKGIELSLETDELELGVAKQLNPQRPYDPEQLSAIEEFPVSGFTQPEVSELGESQLSQLTGSLRKSLESKKKQIILATSILLGLSATLIYFSLDPSATSPFDSATTQIEPTPARAVVEPESIPSEPVETKAVERASEFRSELVENPYWPLPNRLNVGETSSIRVSSQLESAWRFGLAHKYPYQRLKTIKEIRSTKNKGASFLLFEALTQQKFWARIEAVFALADLGLQVNVDAVDQAIGDARPALVSNYFRRFLSRTPTAGELYVLRQAIRLVDASSRVLILEILSELGGDINQLYLVAASYDPSPKIKSWYQKNNSRVIVGSSSRQRYQEIMSAYTSGNLESEVIVEQLNFQPDSEDSEKMLEDVEFFKDVLDRAEQEIVAPTDIDGFEDLKPDE